MTVDEHQEIMISYINNIPVDSNRYLISKQLIKDLEYDRHKVDIPKYIRTKKMYFYEGKKITSITKLSKQIDVTRNKIMYDIQSGKFKYGIYLI